MSLDLGMRACLQYIIIVWAVFVTVSYSQLYEKKGGSPGIRYMRLVSIDQNQRVTMFTVNQCFIKMNDTFSHRKEERKRPRNKRTYRHPPRP